MSLGGGNIDDEICPNLKPDCKREAVRDKSGRPHYRLRHIQNDIKLPLSQKAYEALGFFDGVSTTRQVQQRCQKELGVGPGFVKHLIWKLVEHGILEDSQAVRLKPSVGWIPKPDGSWLLRNPEDMTYLEVHRDCKEAIDLLGKLPPSRIIKRCRIPPDDFRVLHHNLKKAGMLQGIERSQPPRKFTLLRLLVQRWTLIKNPDRWLKRLANRLRWVWTTPYFLLLCGFLVVSLMAGWSWRSDLIETGQQILAEHSSGFPVFFAIGVLLMLVIVPLHELAHALTLTHYGGIVPEIGVMLMLFIPTIYTNTTDSYQFVDRRQRRMSVVAAGIVCQLAIAAVCLWVWRASEPATTLHTLSYLLGIAALFPIAVNTNPLTKFDGYYFLCAWTGIDNLRARSIRFYRILLSGHIPRETIKDWICLAAYAPACVLHILVVFGGLLLFIVQQAPVTVLSLLLVWGIYRLVSSLRLFVM